MENKMEVWRRHPEIKKIEVSSLGRVRSVNGHYYKACRNRDGYLSVSFNIDGKKGSKRINRLVAQTFLPNPDNLPMVNHKNCIRDDNRVDNLEFCTASYNSQYREKYGVSQTEASGHPLFAINLSTLEATRFRSQHEASRELGVYQQNINKVIKGKRKQAGGYYFKEDDGNGIEIDEDKLNGITDSMLFTGSIFAIPTQSRMTPIISLRSLKKAASCCRL